MEVYKLVRTSPSYLGCGQSYAQEDGRKLFGSRIFIFLWQFFYFYHQRVLTSVCFSCLLDIVQPVSVLIKYSVFSKTATDNM